MSMTDWAKEEVRIACKRERAASQVPEGEWDYGCACYESALKAFNSLMEDGHSGCSIGFTKDILVHLIEGKPLTPIEDTPDVWNDMTCRENNYVTYQCKRMYSLFKDVYKDGTIKYTDTNRVYCVYIDEPDISWSNGFVRKIIDEMFPISMPYFPNDRYKVVCEEFLTDKNNGDYDTLGVLYAENKKSGSVIDIHRYFKDDVNGNSFIEISIDEYNTRHEMALKLKGETKNE